MTPNAGQQSTTHEDEPKHQLSLIRVA